MGKEPGQYAIATSDSSEVYAAARIHYLMSTRELAARSDAWESRCLRPPTHFWLAYFTTACINPWGPYIP
jgi:hypothetical protein